MKKRIGIHQHRHAVNSNSHSSFRIALMLTAFLFLAASSGNGIAGNVGQVELAPGKSETCIGSPCTVTFVMPAGSGTYEVVQDDPNGTKLGDYPAGETVKLGDFYDSTMFFVKGGDFKPAHLWIEGNF